MSFSKSKKKLLKLNCFFIKRKKIWRFFNIFFKKSIIQKSNSSI